jgi:hypothetical protein
MVFKISLIAISLTLTSAAFAKIDLRAPVASVQDGSYLLMEGPLLIRKGTTSLYAAQKKSKGKKVPGPLCELRLSIGTGFDIFKKNLLLKSGTKMYFKDAGPEMILVNEDQSVQIPVRCRYYVKSKKTLKESSKFTIRNLAQVFSRIGTIYLVDDAKTAKN